MTTFTYDYFISISSYCFFNSPMGLILSTISVNMFANMKMNAIYHLTTNKVRRTRHCQWSCALLKSTHALFWVTFALFSISGHIFKELFNFIFQKIRLFLSSRWNFYQAQLLVTLKMGVTPECLSLKWWIFLILFGWRRGQLLLAVKEVFLVQKGYYAKWLMFEGGEPQSVKAQKLGWPNVAWRWTYT